MLKLLYLSTRKMGFEPIITVLKTAVLPLNYSLQFYLLWDNINFNVVLFLYSEYIMISKKLNLLLNNTVFL